MIHKHIYNSSSYFDCSESIDESPDFLLLMSVAPCRTFFLGEVESVSGLTLEKGAVDVAAEWASPDSNIFFDAAKELLRIKVDLVAAPPGLFSSGG